MLTAMAANAQNTEKSDTVLSVNNAKNIIIIEEKSGIKVVVKGTESDSTYTSTFVQPYSDNAMVRTHQTFRQFRQPNGSHWISGGLYFGFVTAPGSPKSIGLEMGKSYEIGMLNAVGYKFSDRNNDNRLSIGIGFSWKNYRTTKNARFSPTDANGIDISTYPEGGRAKYSRLKSFSLSLPVIYERSLIKKGKKPALTLSAGAILNWNSHASLSTAWINEDGNEVEQKTNHIGHRKFTVDFIGIVNYKSMGIYARYCPQSFLHSGKGPDFRTFSTGLIFLY